MVCLQIGRRGPPLPAQMNTIECEKVSCVTRSYGVTVLPFEITLKFEHLKFQQKYKRIVHVIFHHHAKFGMQRNFVQDETKK